MSSEGGVIGHEISGMRKEQVAFEKNVAKSNSEFAEYLKNSKEEIERIQKMIMEEASIPADALQAKNVNKLPDHKTVGFLKKLSEIFK